MEVFEPLPARCGRYSNHALGVEEGEAFLLSTCRAGAAISLKRFRDEDSSRVLDVAVPRRADVLPVIEKPVHRQTHPTLAEAVLHYL